MDILAIVGIIGGIMLIIKINIDHRRWKKYDDERSKEYRDLTYRLERYCWLYEMGYRETASSFRHYSLY